jgi:YesN/AraC family two-component response regulator
MLAILGYEVSSADNGEKALRIFLRSKIDIVISDYEMPGMDGVTLAHIKNLSALVILMTGAARAPFIRMGTVWIGNP